jgi:hypothetical protein
MKKIKPDIKYSMWVTLGIAIVLFFILHDLFKFLYFFSNNKVRLIDFSFKMVRHIAGALALYYFCVRRAKKHISIDADDLLIQDRRPPVLYLRTFSIENTKHPFFKTWFFKEPQEKYIDEEIKDITDHYGPLVAIDDPSKHVQELGAARKSIGEKDWQLEVSKLMNISKLIVVNASGRKKDLSKQKGKDKKKVRRFVNKLLKRNNRFPDENVDLYKQQNDFMTITKGIIWEVNEIIDKNFYKKLLLVIPGDLFLYESFREATIKIFPKPLPVLCPKVGRLHKFLISIRFIDTPKICGFIAFNHRWDPYFVKLKKLKLREQLKEEDDFEKRMSKEAFEKAIQYSNS